MKAEVMSASDGECLVERRWYVFVLTSLLTFFGGVIIIVTVRYATDGVRKWRRVKMERQTSRSVDSSSKKKQKSLWWNTIPIVYTRVQFYAEKCVSGKKLIGKIMVMLVA